MNEEENNSTAEFDQDIIIYNGLNWMNGTRTDNQLNAIPPRPYKYLSKDVLKASSNVQVKVLFSKYHDLRRSEQRKLLKFIEEIKMNDPSRYKNLIKKKVIKNIVEMDDKRKRFNSNKISITKQELTNILDNVSSNNSEDKYKKVDLPSNEGNKKCRNEAYKRRIRKRNQNKEASKDNDDIVIKSNQSASEILEQPNATFVNSNTNIVFNNQLFMQPYNMMTQQCSTSINTVIHNQAFTNVPSMVPPPNVLNQNSFLHEEYNKMMVALNNTTENLSETYTNQTTNTRVEEKQQDSTYKYNKRTKICPNGFSRRKIMKQPCQKLEKRRKKLLTGQHLSLVDILLFLYLFYKLEPLEQQKLIEKMKILERTKPLTVAFLGKYARTTAPSDESETKLRWKIPPEVRLENNDELDWEFKLFDDESNQSSQIEKEIKYEPDYERLTMKSDDEKYNIIDLEKETDQTIEEATNTSKITLSNGFHQNLQEHHSQYKNDRVNFMKTNDEKYNIIDLEEENDRTFEEATKTPGITLSNKFQQNLQEHHPQYTNDKVNFISEHQNAEYPINDYNTNIRFDYENYELQNKPFTKHIIQEDKNKNSNHHTTTSNENQYYVEDIDSNNKVLSFSSQFL